jgi:DnaJ-class molecular chaperone
MKFRDWLLGKQPDKLPVLDVECYNCDGTGNSRKPPSFVKCDVCGGSGRQFTQAGVDLFNFISIHREWILNSLNKPKEYAK